MITFKVYMANDGIRWRALAGNARIIADSGEAYLDKRDAHRAIDLLLMAGAQGSYALVDVTQDAMGGHDFIEKKEE